MNGTVYVPVQANEVMPMNEGGSNAGGYQVSGYYVNWDMNGITGTSWPTSDNITKYPDQPPESNPFGDYTQDDIQLMISNGGNLDTIFVKWGETHDTGEELEFLSWAERNFGSTENAGCIGERRV